MFSYPETKYSFNPFAHAIVLGAWDEGVLGQCKADADSIQWTGAKNFHGSQHKVFCNEWEKLPASVLSVIHEASQPKFLRWLEVTTGEKGLMPDPYLHGGGVHRINRGGFLKMHADFNYHEGLSLYRRLNLLLYLNAGWDWKWGGALELAGNGTNKMVAPLANTMVVFTTDDKSFHGHPGPLLCPDDVHRDSIALYYYSAVKPKNFADIRLNTDYRG